MRLREHGSRRLPRPHAQISPVCSHGIIIIRLVYQLTDYGTKTKANPLFIMVGAKLKHDFISFNLLFMCIVFLCFVFVFVVFVFLRKEKEAASKFRKKCSIHRRAEFRGRRLTQMLRTHTFYV